MKSPAANGGWVKAYRRKWEHPIFNDMQEAAVWAWMCEYAAHQAVTIKTKYGPIHLKRGEILIAGRQIAKDFCMSHGKARRLIAKLAAPGTQGGTMVLLKKARNGARTGTIATIVNYNKYQDLTAQHQLQLEAVRHAQGHGDGDSLGTEAAQEQGREGKKKDSMVDSVFEEFWETYPSRGSASNPRKPALEKFRLKVETGASAEDIVRGAEGFAATIARRRAQEGDGFNPVTAVCQAVTFINQHRWEQYAPEAEAPLTDEQRAVLARHNGGKREWHAPNVVELRVGSAPEEQAAEAG